jgi:hypothetical protein
MNEYDRKALAIVVVIGFNSSRHDRFGYLRIVANFAHVACHGHYSFKVVQLY